MAASGLMPDYPADRRGRRFLYDLPDEPDHGAICSRQVRLLATDPQDGGRDLQPVTDSASRLNRCWLVCYDVERVLLEPQRDHWSANELWPLGRVVSGHKKDVVITNRLLRNPARAAIYGWHRLDGDPIPAALPRASNSVCRCLQSRDISGRADDGLWMAPRPMCQGWMPSAQRRRTIPAPLWRRAGQKKSSPRWQAKA